MTVRVTAVLPRSVPPLFARALPGNAGKRPRKSYLKVPSEGRGHWFESSRVHQLSQPLSDTPTKGMFVLSFGLRPCGAVPFARRSGGVPLWVAAL